MQAAGVTDAARERVNAYRPEVADALAPGVDRMVDEALDAVVEAVRPPQDWLQDVVRGGVDQALRGFLELLRTGEDAHLPGRHVYFAFGRGEYRAGHSLDALLTAYRVGAQAAWRRIALDGEAVGLAPRTRYALAEAIFAYIDRISSATAEGFAHEQSLAAGERIDTRRRLVDLLLRDPPADPDVLAGAAAEARWRLPAQVAVIAARGTGAARGLGRLLPDALVARVDGVAYAVVPDPDAPGRIAALAELCAVCAGAGPATPVHAAHESARQALLALELARDEDGARLVCARDRRADLLLLEDPAIATALAEELDSALAPLSPQSRERLLETVDMWLAHQGEVRAVAAALHLHAQTVRYRLSRARELLGDRMRTPGGRLELELALRARRLRAAGTTASGARLVR